MTKNLARQWHVEASDPDRVMTVRTDDGDVIRVNVDGTHSWAIPRDSAKELAEAILECHTVSA